jgi:hypothetical protein
MAAAQASAAMKKVQTQATQVQTQTKSEVPPKLVAKEVQPEAQLESTAKAMIPAVTADTAYGGADYDDAGHATKHTEHHVSTGCRHVCRPSSQTSSVIPRHGCSLWKRA